MSSNEVKKEEVTSTYYDDAEEVLIKYLESTHAPSTYTSPVPTTETETTTTEKKWPPRIICCDSSRSFYCSECCTVLISEKDWPKVIKEGNLHLPFDIDIILYQKERRASATGIHMVAISSILKKQYEKQQRKIQQQSTHSSLSSLSLSPSSSPSEEERTQQQDELQQRLPRTVRLFDVAKGDVIPSYNNESTSKSEEVNEIVEGNNKNDTTTTTTTNSNGIYVLYPTKNSIPISSIPTNGIKKLIVLDCKWPRNQDKVYMDKAIESLQCVHLSKPLPSKSYYWRWHNLGDNMLSTIEAIYFAMYQTQSSNLLLSNKQQRHNLVYVLWLFALQRSIITQRSKDEQRIVPFSEESKEIARAYRRQTHKMKKKKKNSNNNNNKEQDKEED